MKRVLLTLALCALLAAPAAATPTLGWWDSEHPRAITALWDFTDEEPDADGSLYKYGEGAIDLTPVYVPATIRELSTFSVVYS